MELIERLQRAVLAGDGPLDREAVTGAVDALARTEAPLATAAERRAVVDGLVGLGPVEALLREPDVTDVFVNGPDDIWVDRHGRLERVSAAFPDGEAVVAAVRRVIAPLGLRLDAASPLVDARMADGSRLHAAIPPVAVEGPIVAVRRFTAAVFDVDGLQASGSVSGAQTAYLEQMVTSRANVLVSGGTGAGKTTLLNALSRMIPAGERVVTVEDAAELQLSGHVVRLEARPPNREGAGAVSLETLVRSALRLRPDRLIVGEVRGPEALDLVTAMNTGHDGSMSTVHANGPADALDRLETLALSGHRAVTAGVVRRQLESALDVIVHVERRGGRRRVAVIGELDGGQIREVTA